MSSDKADRSLAIVIEMLYSTCILETGTVNVLDLIRDIISRVRTANWYASKIDNMYIGKGGCSEQRLEVD